MQILFQHLYLVYQLFPSHDPDGKVDETMPGDPERFVGSGGDEIDSADTDDVTIDRPDKDAEIGFALEEGDIRDEPLSALVDMGTADMNLWHVAKLIDAGILKDSEKNKALKVLDPSRKLDESYATLVNKLKKQGKSEKAAKAIAGAVASYKAKGGGKGPTAKQRK